MSLREYFYHQFYSDLDIQLAGQQWRQIVDEMFKEIEKRIDERIDFITETFFGHHTILIAKKVELEYVKEMLK